MKLYDLVAVQDGLENITHQGLSITKATAIIRYLVWDGWTVTLFAAGEGKHVAPPPKPQPFTHPWKAKAAVPGYMRRRP